MTSPIILAVTLLAAPSLRAQIVADGATCTLSNVTTNITDDVTAASNTASKLDAHAPSNRLHRVRIIL